MAVRCAFAEARIALRSILSPMDVLQNATDATPLLSRRQERPMRRGVHAARYREALQMTTCADRDFCFGRERAVDSGDAQRSKLSGRERTARERRRRAVRLSERLGVLARRLCTVCRVLPTVDRPQPR